jgi:hypothetical protein
MILPTILVVNYLRTPDLPLHLVVNYFALMMDILSTLIFLYLEGSKQAAAAVKYKKLDYRPGCFVYISVYISVYMFVVRCGPGALVLCLSMPFLSSNHYSGTPQHRGHGYIGTRSWSVGGPVP